MPITSTHASLVLTGSDNAQTMLCACKRQCGLPVPLARTTDPQRGRVQGQPLRYRRGHAPRQRRVTLKERFWVKVDKTTTPDSCWIWIGALDDKGYGRIGLGNRPVPAARVAWMLTHGAIPERLEVCHHCDIRACVRPSHLFVDTHAGNMADMHRKGRAKGAPRGERHPRARLTAEQVIQIIHLRWAGMSHRKLARQFGVAPVTVQQILDRKIWAYLVVPTPNMSPAANPDLAQVA